MYSVRCKSLPQDDAHPVLPEIYISIVIFNGRPGVLNLRLKLENGLLRYNIDTVSSVFLNILLRAYFEEILIGSCVILENVWTTLMFKF